MAIFLGGGPSGFFLAGRSLGLTFARANASSTVSASNLSVRFRPRMYMRRASESVAFFFATKRFIVDLAPL